MRKDLEYYTEKFNKDKTEENFINILNEILTSTNQDRDYFKNLIHNKIITTPNNKRSVKLNDILLKIKQLEEYIKKDHQPEPMIIISLNELSDIEERLDECINHWQY